ncbi:hypothetical protein ACFLTT_01715 [Chloroflexota bacterium]
MQTTIIITGIIILGVILSLAYIPNRMQPRRFDSLFKFLLTLLATLTGVFLAFQISNFQEVQQEKNFLLALLEQSATGLEVEIEIAQKNYNTHIESGSNINDFEQFMNTHPVRGNISLDIMLNSTLLPQFASSNYGEIGVIMLELQNYRDSINSNDVDPNIRLELLKSYMNDIYNLREILLTEISYIQGDISNEEVLDEYNKLNIP